MTADSSGKKRREGEVLKGKYRLDRYIAAGGMGEVYQATNLALDRIVAVKVLLDQFVTNQENVQRFMQEARTASMVQHPNIVQVYDIDEAESGAPFIVQEFLRGETLAQRLRRTGERMQGKHVLDILIPVVEAIGEAHKAGIVHRDIKPSNVFLTRQDRGIAGKVLDFGISRVGTPADDVRLTRTTAVLGSPAYMAPEQVQSARNATARSDVWSIGVMMYELLAGELPFRGETSSEVMVNVCSKDPVSLHEAAPGIASGLAKVVSRCLSRRVDERYLDGESLAMALREVRDQEFTARQTQAQEASPTPAGGTTFPNREPTAANAASTADKPGELSIDSDTTSGRFPAQPAASTSHNDPAGEPTPDARDHPSYGDIPAIIAGFAILAGILALSAAFAPPAPGEGELGTQAQVVQLLLAAGIVYLAQWVQGRASQYSATGATVSVLGLYGLAATLALLAGAAFIGEAGMLPVLATLLSASVGVTAVGFAVVGFEYVKEQIMVEKLITLPGVAVGVFALLSLFAGAHYLFSTLG